MGSAKQGYHVVVNDRDFLYVTRHKRVEDDDCCFDECWQAIGFFETRREARRFAQEISELTEMRIV